MYGMPLGWGGVLVTVLLNSNTPTIAGGYTLLGWMNGVKKAALTHARVSADYACWYNASTGVGKGCPHGMTGACKSYDMVIFLSVPCLSMRCLL